ncbi:MAG: FAD-dependent oxidoreductase, partial [Planctomycetaceae bacterium]|nr:FAD-dependent oxidoreductase [Planctomycetaceae bacterium]
MTASKSQRIVIVGGGISGLSIAVRLVQAGLPVTLVEGSELGFGASTRNQGWLYSGAWFAPENPLLAAQCYRSLQQTLFFCPECVEPDQSGMFYVISKKSTRPDKWSLVWTNASIPFDPIPIDTFLGELPHWNPDNVHKVWELPDRAIRTDILLRRLMEVADDRGVEFRTGTPIAGLMRSGSHVQGVVTTNGEEIPARLVILATGGETGLWSEASVEAPGDQPSYQLVNLKTHLLAIPHQLSPRPFCVLDRGGFNHIPHTGKSIFGSNHWEVVSRPDDVQAEKEEIQRILDLIHQLLPSWSFSKNEIIDWAGTTVQAMHVE